MVIWSHLFKLDLQPHVKNTINQTCTRQATTLTWCTISDESKRVQRRGGRLVTIQKQAFSSGETSPTLLPSTLQPADCLLPEATSQSNPQLGCKPAVTCLATGPSHCIPALAAMGESLPRVCPQGPGYL